MEGILVEIGYCLVRLLQLNHRLFGITLFATTGMLTNKALGKENHQPTVGAVFRCGSGDVVLRRTPHGAEVLVGELMPDKFACACHRHRAAKSALSDQQTAELGIGELHLTTETGFR